MSTVVDVESAEASGIEFAEDGKACLVTMWGEVDASLRNTAREALAAATIHDGRIELDLARVQFMDSAGLSFVIQLYALGQSADREVALRSVSDPVHELLEMVGLADRLPVVRSRGH